MNARHLRVAGGRSRCGRGTEKTFDEIRVTCLRCRDLGLPREMAPKNAFRIPGTWMPLTELDGGERGELNLHNVLFIDGGSLVWFEEPNVVAVLGAREAGRVRRYEGTWEPRVERQPRAHVRTEGAL